MAETWVFSMAELWIGSTTKWGPTPKQSWGLYRDGAMVHHAPLSWERVLGTLTPCDLVTCYQAQRLSEHTSPCGACAYLTVYCFFF
jgi:hypothetical protein